MSLLCITPGCSSSLDRLSGHVWNMPWRLCKTQLDLCKCLLLAVRSSLNIVFPPSGCCGARSGWRSGRRRRGGPVAARGGGAGRAQQRRWRPGGHQGRPVRRPRGWLSQRRRGAPPPPPQLPPDVLGDNPMHSYTHRSPCTCRMPCIPVLSAPSPSTLLALPPCEIGRMLSPAGAAGAVHGDGRASGSPLLTGSELAGTACFRAGRGPVCLSVVELKLQDELCIKWGPGGGGLMGSGAIVGIYAGSGFPGRCAIWACRWRWPAATSRRAPTRSAFSTSRASATSLSATCPCWRFLRLLLPARLPARRGPQPRSVCHVPQLLRPTATLEHAARRPLPWSCAASGRSKANTSPAAAALWVRRRAQLSCSAPSAYCMRCSSAHVAAPPRMLVLSQVHYAQVVARHVLK